MLSRDNAVLRRHERLLSGGHIVLRLYVGVARAHELLRGRSDGLALRRCPRGVTNFVRQVVHGLGAERNVSALAGRDEDVRGARAVARLRRHEGRVGRRHPCLGVRDPCLRGRHGVIGGGHAVLGLRHRGLGRELVRSVRASLERRERLLRRQNLRLAETMAWFAVAMSLSVGGCSACWRFSCAVCRLSCAEVSER